MWKNQKGAFNPDNKRKQSITRKSNLQIKLEKIYRYLIKSGGKATRGQILASRILKGGVKEYERILGSLEKAEKINVDRAKTSKQEWVYLVV